MDEARSQLSRLGRMAWEGEEITITEGGEPYLRLEPYHRARRRRTLGLLAGQIEIASDFDDTPQGIVDSFYESSLVPGEHPG